MRGSFSPYLVQAVQARRLAALWVSRGHGRLASFAKQVVPWLRRRARGATLYVLCDAAAAAKTAALWDLVGTAKKQVTLVRVPRRPSYRKAWAKLPAEQWQRIEEAGPYKAAPAKVIFVTATQTMLPRERKGRAPQSVPVRTIVVRERAQRGKERWHALWIFGDDEMPPYEVVKLYRGRQGHEQAYRILLHDTYVDTAPSGYDKNSPQPKRPGFKRNALTLYAWIASLVYNTLEALTQQLPKRFGHAHPRTLRRWFFLVPAELFLGERCLIVLLQPRLLRSLWQELVRKANRHPVRIPWLDDRQLILSVEPTQPSAASQRAERARALDQAQQLKGRKIQSFQRQAA